MDRRGRDLAQADAAQLAPVDVLLHGCEGVLHRHPGVAAGALEDVETLAPAQLRQDVVDAPPDALGRPVWACGTGGALDAEHHLVRVLRVLGEVALEQNERVVRRRAVDLAAVPEVAPVVESGAHRREGLLLRRRGGAPGESWCGVSSGRASSFIW